jgi:RNA polymerase sigma-70 factor (sigma-E family)
VTGRFTTGPAASGTGRDARESEDDVAVTWAASASAGVSATLLTGEHVLGPIPDTADPWGTPAVAIEPGPASGTVPAVPGTPGPIVVPPPVTNPRPTPTPWPSVTTGTARAEPPAPDLTRITSEHPALKGGDGPGTVAMATAEHVALAVAGDAFDTFYRAEKPRVVAVVSSLTGDRAAAEDIVQEAFATAMRRWATVSGYERPGDWVKRVAVNRAISRFRRRQSESRALGRLAGRTGDDDIDLTSPSPAQDHWDDDPLWAAVRKLPRRQAQAVVLVYVDDLSLERVAEILQCSVGSVKTHLHRARQRLAAELGSLPGEPGSANRGPAR